MRKFRHTMSRCDRQVNRCSRDKFDALLNSDNGAQLDLRVTAGVDTVAVNSIDRDVMKVKSEGSI